MNLRQQMDISTYSRKILSKETNTVFKSLISSKRDICTAKLSQIELHKRGDDLARVKDLNII